MIIPNIWKKCSKPPASHEIHIFWSTNSHEHANTEPPSKDSRAARPTLPQIRCDLRQSDRTDPTMFTSLRFLKQIKDVLKIVEVCIVDF